MSQLSNPLLSGLLPFEKALEELVSRAQISEHTVSLPLHKTLGHVVARDVVALRDVPPFRNAAVDGYGFSYKNVISQEGNKRRFLVSHTLLAGDKIPLHDPDKALAIMTGASLPPTVDMMVMKEDVEREGDEVILPEKGLEKGMNVRDRGEDIKKNETLLKKGDVIAPPDVALLASQGYTDIEIVRPLRVGLLSTGGEVTESEQGDSSAVFDANRPMLSVALSFLGFHIVDGGIVSDHRETLEHVLLSLAKECDVVITTGGMSVGMSDHIASLIADHGQIFFHGVAMKPGRPVGFGKIFSSYICGLPGNPVAAYTCFLTLIVPFLRVLRGMSLSLNVSRETLIADFDYKKRKGMREFVRVAVHRDKKGQLIGKKYGRSGAAMISSLSQASGFAMIHEDFSHVSQGQLLPFLPFKDLLS